MGQESPLSWHRGLGAHPASPLGGWPRGMSEPRRGRGRDGHTAGSRQPCRLRGRGPKVPSKLPRRHLVPTLSPESQHAWGLRRRALRLEPGGGLMTPEAAHEAGRVGHGHGHGPATAPHGRGAPSLPCARSAPA